MTTNGSVTAVLFSSVSVSGTLTYGCLSGSLLGSVTAGTTVKDPTNATFPDDYASTYPNICTNPPNGLTVVNTSATTLLNSGLPSVTSGIICDPYPVVIAASGFSGNWTIVAPSITVGASALNLNPAASYLPQFWATTGGISLIAVGYDGGTAYAPNGTISVTAAGATFTGYLEAQEISVTAAHVTLNGDGRSPAARSRPL